jgi:hypothetical protein
MKLKVIGAIMSIALAIAVCTNPSNSDNAELPYGGQCGSILETWGETKEALSGGLGYEDFENIILKNIDFPKVETQNLTTAEQAYLDKISEAWWEVYKYNKNWSFGTSSNSSVLINQADVRINKECAVNTRPAPDSSAIVVQPLNGNCKLIQRSIRDAYDSVKLTDLWNDRDRDVLLEFMGKSGAFLSQEFDETTIKNLDHLTLVRDTGVGILRIRESVLLDRVEIDPVQEKIFVANYNKINSICQK